MKDVARFAIYYPDVPAVLRPTYLLMKRLFFYSPLRAAEPLLWMSSPQAEQAGLASGDFVNMRRREPLEPSVREGAAVQRVRDSTLELLGNELGEGVKF